jgi:NIMA (never in mitosis gene a)-related kinase
MVALTPPFKAKNMQGLYKKVIKAKVKRIPSFYSNELQAIIKMMLRLKPS